MENTGNDSGTISPEDAKKLEDAIKQKQIGAVRIYDGALSEEFCDELIEVFEANSENHEEVDNERIRFLNYRYSKFHGEEEVHENLKTHIMGLYEHYLGDLDLPNMIAHSGIESLSIKKYEQTEEEMIDPHIDAVDHKSAIRAIGFLFYLDNNKSMTNFPRQGVGVESIKGRVVIYPSTWEYPIIEKTPTEGSKYNLQTWLHYA